MKLNIVKIIGVGAVAALVIGFGANAWQSKLASDVKAPAPLATADNSGTAYSNNIFQITYPKGWTHKTMANGDDYFFKGDLPSEAQIFSSKQTSLAIVEPLSLTDQGLCLNKMSEKSITTKNGLTFNLTFNTNDKKVEVCKDAFDQDFVQVLIGNSLNKQIYFTYLQTDREAEKDLESLLQSIKLK